MIKMELRCIIRLLYQTSTVLNGLGRSVENIEWRSSKVAPTCRKGTELILKLEFSSSLKELLWDREEHSNWVILFSMSSTMNVSSFYNLM